jgi:hypothetical protein
VRTASVNHVRQQIAQIRQEFSWFGKNQIKTGSLSR